MCLGRPRKLLFPGSYEVIVGPLYAPACAAEPVCPGQASEVVPDDLMKVSFAQEKRWFG